MVCEHEYMNISPPPIIQLATALRRDEQMKQLVHKIIARQSNV